MQEPHSLKKKSFLFWSIWYLGRKLTSSEVLRRCSVWAGQERMPREWQRLSTVSVYCFRVLAGSGVVVCPPHAHLRPTHAIFDVPPMGRWHLCSLSLSLGRLVSTSTNGIRQTRCRVASEPPGERLRGFRLFCQNAAIWSPGPPCVECDGHDVLCREQALERLQ